MGQLHKKFQDHQVKELIQRYLSKEIERSYIQEILGIKKTRFFALVKKYKEDPDCETSPALNHYVSSIEPHFQNYI